MNYEATDLLNSDDNLKNSLTKYWQSYRDKYHEDPEGRRNPDTVISGVIHPDEINRYYNEYYLAPSGGDMLLNNGFTIFDNGTLRDDVGKSACFVTDDSSFCCTLLRNRGFLACTFNGLPFKLGKLGTGKILNTFEEFIEHFYKGQKVLKTTEELADYINENPFFKP